MGSIKDKLGNTWKTYKHPEGESRKIKELSNVHEGDRIVGAINVLKKGGSDKSAKAHLEGEFPKGTLKTIKKELGFKRKK
tara:strand:+ start:291 stop:530 length:240 start_codon:yes stop_codon:yes gene_type:complete